MNALQAAFCALLVPSVSLAGTVTLESNQDNTLYEDGAGSFSNGAGIYVYAGRTQSGAIRNAVLAFDVAGAIPAGSTITGVTLNLNCNRVPPGFSNEAFDLHRLLAAWGEGTSNAGDPGGMGTSSAANDATWIHTFFPGSFWATAGGDFNALASSSVVVGDTGMYSMLGVNLVADVQDMLDTPATNFGWLIRDSDNSFGSARRFASREDTVAANRPTLEVTFDAPALGTSYCTASMNSVGMGMITATGSDQASPLNVTLQAAPVPNTTGLFFFGPNQLANEPPFGEGVRCVGGVTQRIFPLVGGSGNVATQTLNSGASYAAFIVPAASLNFQYWFRTAMNAGDLDGDGMVEPFCTTDGLNIVFQ